MYRLLFKGDTDPRTALATRSPLIFIGRGPDCHLRLLDPGVCERHAAIERGEDGYYLRALGGPNGVRVNGELVNQRRLGTGDEVEIGAVKLIFEMLHPPPVRRRVMDPWVLLAGFVMAATVVGQVAVLIWIFSTPRPRRPAPAPAPAVSNAAPAAVVAEPAPPGAARHE